MSKIKPCPNCGSDGSKLGIFHLMKDNDFMAVGCINCGVAGSIKKSEEDAIESWNALPRRPTWTKARPTKPGFYFYRRKTWEPKIVHIKLLEIVHRKGVTDVLVHTETCMLQMPTLKGEWAGPIPEPLA